jgi:hypothetical protein
MERSGRAASATRAELQMEVEEAIELPVIQQVD